MKRPRQLLTRREALRLGLAGLTSMISVTEGCNSCKLQQQKALSQPPTHLKPPQKYLSNVMGSLKKRAESKGIIYGAATDAYKLSNDPEFASHFVQECGILSPEGGLKWDPLRPSPDRFDFTLGDWLAEFTHRNNILLRGHTLVWEQALPDWFKETVNHKNAENFLVEHITTVVKHYAGRMHSWDVVNEAIDPTSGRSDGLRVTPWLQFVGPEYIDLAFRVAAKADPKALLVYNDFDLEYDNPSQDARRRDVLRLLERLKAGGTPIHAFGLQGHIGTSRLGTKKIRAFLQDIASLGLKILVTELDVQDDKLPSDIQVRDRIVASVYEDFLNVVLDEPAVIAILTWGLSDRYTWISEFAHRSDCLPLRPLPLDQSMKRKPAWDAIARAFDHAPQR